MKRKLTSEFLIDGAPMLTPDAGINLEHTRLLSQDSGRDESGYLHEVVLREDMKAWRFTYAFLTAEEYAYARSLLRGKTKLSFTYKNENGETETVKAGWNQTGVSYWSARRGLYRDLQFEIYEL